MGTREAWAFLTERERTMIRLVLRLIAMGAMVFLGGVIYIRYVYGCSWQESFAIADQFVADLLG
jgi:hypothetical protein